MGVYLLGFLLLAGLQTCAADSASLRSRNLIIGGTTAPDGRYPYYVALKDAWRKVQCGGTLIAPDIVLTAAHCRNSDLKYADIGRYSSEEGPGMGEEIEILNPLEMISSGNWSTPRNLEKANHTILDAAGFIHPQHDLAARTYDVMLMKLARPASPERPLVKINVEPEFPVKQPGGRNEITIVGMGNEEVNTFGYAPNSKDLKQVHVDYLPYEECVDVENYNLDYKFELLPHMICTQGAGIYGDRGQCYGDSGGPYIIRGNDATGADDVQVGVVSWAVNCANSLFPMVGSRTSHSLKFIKEVTCSMSSNPPAYLCAQENNSVDSAIDSRFIPDGVKVSVRIFADPWGHELRWKIFDFADPNRVYAEAPFGKIVGDHSFQDVIVPAGGTMKFKIEDAADDGIYGNPEAILYEVVLVKESGELVIVEGNGQFGTTREETFRVPQISDDYLALVRNSKADASSNHQVEQEGPTAPLKIYIEFADYHEDAAWKVTSLDGKTTYAFKNANEYRYGNDVTEQVDLAAGNYKFTISDRRGSDEFRAFNFYKLSYLNRQQRTGLGGAETELLEESHFNGEVSSHEFVIPVAATFDPVGTAPSKEVIIGDQEFIAEAAVSLCDKKKVMEYCTGDDQCCSGKCSIFRCVKVEADDLTSTSAVPSASANDIRMRGSIGTSSAHRRPGYDRA